MYILPMIKRLLHFFPLLILLYLLRSPYLLADNTVNLHSSLTLNNMALRDQSMSPLKYGGWLPGAGISLEISGKQYIFFNLHAQSGSLSNQFNNLLSFGIVSLKNHTFYSADTEKRFLYGWSNVNMLQYYVYENYGNFRERSNYFTAFGPALLYRESFSFLGLDFSLQIPLDYQLLGFYLRPSYISNNPDGFLDPANNGFTAWLRSLEIFLPSRARELAVHPRISCELSSGNTISLSYLYTFTGIGTPEPVTISRGTWYLSLVTRL
jgi:hypothetical protein